MAPSRCFPLLKLTAARFLLVLAVLQTSVAQKVQIAGENACDALQAQIDQLPQADRGLLDRYGILLRSEWIISPTLVSNCETRRGLSRYLQAALAGSLRRRDRVFVQSHKRDLVVLLGHIWQHIGTNDAVRSDGALIYEKWGILESADLSDAELTPLLRKSLAAEGLSASFVHFALHRRLSGLRGDLQEVLRRERNPATARDLTETTAIYCLALLYGLDISDVSSHLSELLADRRTTSKEKSVIQSLQTRIAAKQPIRWGDLEPLDPAP